MMSTNMIVETLGPDDPPELRLMRALADVMDPAHAISICRNQDEQDRIAEWFYSKYHSAGMIQDTVALTGEGRWPTNPIGKEENDR